MKKWIENMWYGHSWIKWLWVPFSLIYQGIVSCRYFIISRYAVCHPVPIIVVGNLSVGGAGKTPLVIALAQALKQHRLKIGIVSRGYASTVRTYPYLVTADSDAGLVGDEPLLIALRTACPVVIAPKRNQAITYLRQHFAVDIIISDDGLQHYAMSRAIEIAVIDGIRQLGNGWCLPAGPLRESARRLKRCDFIIINESKQPNAYTMRLVPKALVQITTGAEASIHDLEPPLAAVAGIGHPQRFFNTLTQLGLSYHAYPFPDHHQFLKKDLNFLEKSILMTEKDAVKCRVFAQPNWYYLSVDAVLPEAFWADFFSHAAIKKVLSL